MFIVVKATKGLTGKKEREKSLSQRFAGTEAIESTEISQDVENLYEGAPLERTMLWKK